MGANKIKTIGGIAMNFPDDLRYTQSHEWARKEGKEFVVGVTEYAQKELSDVVYVEAPELDAEVEAGGQACVVESVKAAFDIYAPVSGKVIAVNEELEGDPGLVNSDPYGAGWLFRIEADDDAAYNELMDAEAYTKHVNG